MHVLIADRQFLLLIDVPIQTEHNQLQIYKTYEYKVNFKYIGVTYGGTKAVVITDLQYRAC